MRKYATLSRNIEVSEIPSGSRGEITAGTPITILQSLGGSFTAMTMMGYMVRIEGKDADAIGEEPPPAPSAADADGKSTVDLAWDQLRTCYDPEIPVNIVDLGLVYQCELTPLDGDGGQKASVQFTLTAPGCGMGDFLRQDVIQKLLAVPGIKEVDAQVVFDPQWNQSMMSDAARLQLGMM